MDIELTVLAGNALTVNVDVLVLKYAQRAHGLDLAVISNITNASVADDMPPPGEYRLVSALRNMKAPTVLFVGVQPLHEFGYSEIRDFARRSLAALRADHSSASTVALTLHGAGFGLDEKEAFESEVAGLLDAVASGSYPKSLQRIVVVESDPSRAKRLTSYLGQLVPNGRLGGRDGLGIDDLPALSQATLRTAGYASASKPNIFVAMPFAPEFDDLYYYGIQGAVQSAGYLCERADLSSFTGDVMDWVKGRISSASLVVADLSGANPNVYLEVGFAWGLRIPTVLLVDKATDLRFDVRGQRVIEYKASIRGLEEKLALELKNMRPDGTARH